MTSSNHRGPVYVHRKSADMSFKFKGRYIYASSKYIEHRLAEVLSVKRSGTQGARLVLKFTDGTTETLYLNPSTVYRIARLAVSRGGFSLFAPANGMFGRY